MTVTIDVEVREPESEALNFTVQGENRAAAVAKLGKLLGVGQGGGDEAIHSDSVTEFLLSRREDGRFKLEMWGPLANGALSEYPIVTHTADDERMRETLKPVGFDNLLDVTLPIRQKGCAVTARWRYGRQTTKGGRYRDLIELLPA